MAEQKLKKSFVYDRASKEDTAMLSYCYLTGCGGKWCCEMPTDRLTLLCKRNWCATDKDLFVKQIVDEVMEAHCESHS